MKKRSRLDIIHDILNAIVQKGGKIKPTHLLYKSNLSHKVMDGYLKELLGKTMVEEEVKGKSKMFSITDKGRDFINKYHSFNDFIDSFGLQEEN